MTFICEDCGEKSNFVLRSEILELNGYKYDVVYFECQKCKARNIINMQVSNLLACYEEIQKLEGTRKTAKELGVIDDEVERQLSEQNARARKLIKGAKQLSKIFKF